MAGNSASHLMKSWSTKRHWISGERHTSSTLHSQDTLYFIFQNCISMYLQMCVEAGFSQIQSHNYIYIPLIIFTSKMASNALQYYNGMWFCSIPGYIHVCVMTNSNTNTVLHALCIVTIVEKGQISHLPCILRSFFA